MSVIYIWNVRYILILQFKAYSSTKCSLSIVLASNGPFLTKLCDFGLWKLNIKDLDKMNAFCGTPKYLAPEILCGQGYNKMIN